MITLSYGQALAFIGVALLAGWMAGYSTWRWWRQPRGDRQEPLAGMHAALDHLDRAARMLSTYVWNPSQADGMLRVARHQIDAAQEELDKIPYKGIK